MGYCTPNNPEDEPYYSMVKCPECEGWGEVPAHDGEMVGCPECDGEGEVIFEQE